MKGLDKTKLPGLQYAQVRGERGSQAMPTPRFSQGPAVIEIPLRRIQVRYKRYAYKIGRDGVAVKEYGNDKFGFMFQHDATFSYDSVERDEAGIHKRVREGILERLGVVETKLPRSRRKPKPLTSVPREPSQTTIGDAINEAGN